MYNRFAIIQQDLCKLERRVLENALAILSRGGNRHALNNLVGPGHRVTVAGSVAYVTKCELVPVLRTDYRNWTQEIPILHNGTHKFADPITYILSDYATVIPCDTITPARWFLDGEW